MVVRTSWQDAAPGPVPNAIRPFGAIADLDVDFATPDRPALVTTLLAQCDPREDATFWWAQPVSARIAALLRLLVLTEARDTLSVSARCVAPGCGDRFEFDLPLRSLPLGVADPGPLTVPIRADRLAVIRRPTGEDLRRWHAAQPATRADAVRLMLDTLVVDGDVVVGDEVTVSAAIAAADPLVDFTVACRCPACDAPNEVAVDLEAIALSRLGARQHVLVREVHQFASRYGWTEAEVLAVPPQRRARYLALMENEP